MGRRGEDAKGIVLKGFKMVHMLGVNVGRRAAVSLEYCD